MSSMSAFIDAACERRASGSRRVSRQIPVSLTVTLGNHSMAGSRLALLPGREPGGAISVLFPI